MSSWTRAEGLLLAAVPPLTILVLGALWLFVGGEHSITFARVWGGPTDGEGPWTGRIELLERASGVDRRVPGRSVVVQWSGDSGRNHVTEFRGATNQDGWLDVTLKRPGKADDLDLVVLHAELGQPLAGGTARLEAERWRSSARRRGGFQETPSSGPLTIRARVVGGVLAVPFESEVEVEVRRGDTPVEDAALTIGLEGLEALSASTRPQAGESESPSSESHPSKAAFGTKALKLATGHGGRARFRVRPLEHSVMLDIAARAPDVEEPASRWYSSLPVVPGAMVGRIDGGRIEIESPIERPSATFAMLSLRERLGGGEVTLSPTPHGGARGSAPVPVKMPLDRDRTWLLVSSSPDTRSSGTVGWPLGDQPRTFDAVDALLLDGSTAAERRESNRRRRFQIALGAYAALSALLTMVLVARRVRRASGEMQSRLRQAGAEEGVLPASGPSGRVAVALLCVAIGFAVVAAVLVARTN